MASKTFYFLDAAATSGGDLMDMQEDGSAPATATMATTGWQCGTNVADKYADMDRAVIVSRNDNNANGWTSPAQPTTTIDSTRGNSARTPTALTGTFASANWTYSWVPRTSSGTAQRGALHVRLFRSTSATGASPTEITAGSAETATMTAQPSSSGTAAYTVTVNPGALTLSGEYLFFLLTYRVTTAGATTGSNILLTKSTDFKVVTSDFTTPVNDSLDARWNTSSVVQDNTDIRWAARTSIADSSDVRWNTKAAVADSSDIRWNTKAAVNDSSDIRWAVRTSIADSSDMRWHTRTAVNDSSDIRWAARTTVNDSSDIRWNTLSGIQDSVTLVWGTKALASDVADFRWATRALVTDNVDLRWNVLLGVLASVGDSLDMRWHTRGRVGNQADIRWMLLIKVADQVYIRWAQREYLTKQLEIQWVVPGVYKTLFILFDTQAHMPPQRTVVIREEVRGVTVPLDDRGEFVPPDNRI